jgi:hypothetical protein
MSKVRHTAVRMNRARELREAGWTYREIQQLLLREEGVLVHRRTIQLWCSPEARETHQRHSRDQKARERATRNGGRLTIGQRTRRPEFVLARAQALSGLGLSVPAIAKVVEFDLNVKLSEAQVRYALQTNRLPALEAAS